MGVIGWITGDVGRGDHSSRISDPSIICIFGLDLRWLIVPAIAAVFGFLLREEASDGASAYGFAKNTIISVCSSSLISVSDTTS